MRPFPSLRNLVQSPTARRLIAIALSASSMACQPERSATVTLSEIEFHTESESDSTKDPIKENQGEGMLYKKGLCPTTEELEGKTIERDEKGIRNQLEQMQNFLNELETSEYHFEFQPTQWDSVLITEAQLIEKINESCVDVFIEVEDWEWSSSASLRLKLAEVLVENSPFLMTVKEEDGLPISIPAFHIQCHLQSDERQEVDGLYFRDPLDYSIIEADEDEKTRDERFKNVARHELIHHYNKKGYDMNNANLIKYYSALSLLGPRILSLTGIPACHPLNYSILNEGRADSIQMMYSPRRYAEAEIRDAHRRRLDNYQMKFHILKNIFFIQLGSEEDFKLRMEKVLRNKELNAEDIQTIARFIEYSTGKGLESLEGKSN